MLPLLVIYMNDVPKMNMFSMLELKLTSWWSKRPRQDGVRTSWLTIWTIYWQWEIKSSTATFDFCISQKTVKKTLSLGIIWKIFRISFFHINVFSAFNSFLIMTPKWPVLVKWPKLNNSFTMDLSSSGSKSRCFNIVLMCMFLTWWVWLS